MVDYIVMFFLFNYMGFASFETSILSVLVFVIEITLYG